MMIWQLGSIAIQLREIAVSLEQYHTQKTEFAIADLDADFTKSARIS
jgi:hypothetical protein